MTDRPQPGAPFSGEQLWSLTEQLRQRMFKATLFLAALLVPPAVLMIVVVGDELGIRLALLAIVGTLCALAAAEAGWCYRRLREQQWWVLLPAFLAAGVLVIGGARQNATFIVVGIAVVGTPTVVGSFCAMTAGSIVVLGYAISLLVRQQTLLLDGSAGDIAAVISLMVAIYAAHRTAELVTLVVADVNRDARAAAPMPGEDTLAAIAARAPSMSTRVIAEEATDQLPDDALRRLSEYGLTPAEREVAYLAGDGRPQKFIAERLGKSTKTVGNQLRSIKAKLNVETHAALTAEIRRLLALPAPDERPSERASLDEEPSPEP
jgi:DNA-binding CsgD family transcriptional regulator